MKIRDILKVEDACKEPMKMLGYHPLHHLLENKSHEEVSLMDRSPDAHQHNKGYNNVHVWRLLNDI